MLAKITAKNQLTLPKSVTEPLGPVQYFDVQTRGGQIVLTPVRIQRGDALRAKLAELALSQKTLDAALNWAETQMGGVKTIETPQKPRAAKAAKPLSTPRAPKTAPKKAAAQKTAKKVAQKTAKTPEKTGRKAVVRTPALKSVQPAVKTIETLKKPRVEPRAKPSSAVAKPRATAAVSRKSAATPSSTAAVRRSTATAAPASRAGRGATASRRAA